MEMKIFPIFLLLSPILAFKRPNIVFILTDDLDFELGGMTPLAKTRKWISEQGVSFNNSFVTTPICCPSRATTLTGLYQHNTKVRPVFFYEDITNFRNYYRL